MNITQQCPEGDISVYRIHCVYSVPQVLRFISRSNQVTKGHAVTLCPPHLARHLVHRSDAWVATSPSKLLGLFHVPVTANLTQFGF